MKPQKGFDWFKLVTTSMFVVGGAGILFFLIVSLTVFNEEPQTSETVVNSDEQTEETSPGRVSRPAEGVEPIQGAESSESESTMSESKDTGMNEQDDSDESDEDFSKAGSLEDDDVESTGLTPEQQQRLVEIEVELAALVDRHKSLRDLIIELSYIGAPRDHLRKERWDLEKPMYILAFEYNRMVPGAIFPDGKIGRILEGVGWHFSPE